MVTGNEIDKQNSFVIFSPFGGVVAIFVRRNDAMRYKKENKTNSDRISVYMIPNDKMQNIVSNEYLKPILEKIKEEF